jgi:hypothetical protein
MKIDLSKVDEICLPVLKTPKKIIGSKAVVLSDILNRAGQVIEAGEIVIVWQSFRGYGIKTTNESGQKIYITRVSPYNIRFLKDGK